MLKMDKRLLTDAVADLEGMSTLEDAMLFRSLYLKAFKQALDLPQAEGLAPRGVTVRVELEGLENLTQEGKVLAGDFTEALAGTCGGIATAALIALVVGVQQNNQTLIQLPADCVRLISRMTLEVSQ